MADKTVQETLKDEGQLVRNTGTNSIKSVKERVSVNTEKLEGVLSTISDKMTSQLELMERMIDLREVEIENAAEQRENLLRQQRLEDVSTEATQEVEPEATGQPPRKKGDDGPQLPGLGTIFGGIFALGAGLPLLYKFFEGFLDERYKDNPKANPLNIIDNVVEGLGSLDIEQITTDFTNLSESLTKISSVLQTLSDKTNEFLEKSWFEQFTTVLTSSIGAIGAALFTIRFATRTLLGKGLVGKALSKALTGGAVGAGAAATGLGASKATGPLRFLRFLRFLGPLSAGATAVELTNVLRQGLDEQDNSLEQLYSMYPETRNLNRGEGVPPSQASYYLEQSQRDPNFIPDLIESQKEQGIFQSPLPKLEEYDGESDVLESDLTQQSSTPLDRFEFEDPTEITSNKFWSIVEDEQQKASELQESIAKLSPETASLLADDQDNGQRLSFRSDQISQPEAVAFGMGFGNVLRFGDNITGGSTIRQGDVYNNITNYTVDPTRPLHFGKSRAN